MSGSILKYMRHITSTARIIGGTTDETMMPFISFRCSPLKSNSDFTSIPISSSVLCRSVRIRQLYSNLSSENTPSIVFVLPISKIGRASCRERVKIYGVVGLVEVKEGAGQK